MADNLVSPLVTSFVDTYHTVREDLDAGKLDLASKTYTELYDLYEKINGSALESYHKELAFDQISSIRQELQSLQSKPTKSKTPQGSDRTRLRPAGLLVCAGAIIIAFSLLVMIRPSLVGLTFFEEHLGEDLGLTFEHSSDYAITLQQVPASLRLSGKLTSGTAKVYALLDGKKILVFDSTRVSLVDGQFADVCMDSCILHASNKIMPLVIELSGGKLFLDRVSYAAESIMNNVPTWVGPEKTFTVSKELTLNLDNYFFDKDGDHLVYLATATTGVKTIIDDNKVTFTNNGASGSVDVTLIASDLKDITRIPVTLQFT